MTPFAIKTNVFEGPLELLLSLIEKRKLFINDISLSKVADEYIEHIKKLGEYSIEESSDFILIASTLILIKSKSLLPNLELTTEEQGNIENLEKRLKLYKIYKESGQKISEIFGEKIIYQSQGRKIDPVFMPDDSMNPSNILDSIKKLIEAIPKIEQTTKASIKKVISLEEMVDNLSVRIKSALKMSFRDFAGAHKGEKVNVIVGFLAMLELVKQGTINANQNTNFSDIEMETNNLDVPRYS